MPDDGRLEANLTAIRDFAETYEDIPVTMMLVPDAACILNDSLPAFARVEDQRQMFSMAERELGDSVNWIDTVSILNNHKSEKLYYKTDHHWTTQGAFYVFPSVKCTGLTSMEFCERLIYDKRVAVVPGSAFGACGEGHVRISYAYSLKHLAEALDRMAAFLQELKG